MSTLKIYKKDNNTKRMMLKLYKHFMYTTLKLYRITAEDNIVVHFLQKVIFVISSTNINCQYYVVIVLYEKEKVHYKLK